MSEAQQQQVGPHADHSAHDSARVSIPWVILAAVLCGIGLFLLSYWLTYFYWPAFGGAGLVILGAALLFSRRTGLDRA